MGIPQQKQEVDDLGLEGGNAAREFLFSEADFRSLVAAGAGAHRHLAVRQQAQPHLQPPVAAAAGARLDVVSRISRISLPPDGDARSKASSTRSRPTSPSSSANPTTSTICATMWPCRSRKPHRARSASGCACGRPAARPARSPIRSRRCCGARSATSTSTTSAFSRPTSTPRCSAKAARGEYPAASIEDVPENYRELFRRNEQPLGAPVVMGDETPQSLISFRHLNLMEPWPIRGHSTRSSAATS